MNTCGTSASDRTFQKWCLAAFAGIALFAAGSRLSADDSPRTIDVWNGAPPGETTLSTGEVLPRRPGEDPPATRIAKITRPQLEVYEPPADRQTGMAIVILPGGGYNYVVTDKEGSEAAQWLNRLGVTAFVLRYRTKDGTGQPLWRRPVQDAQRAMSLLRARAADWKLDPHRVGILGFSAGGQVAAIATARGNERLYEGVDEIDRQPCRPDFALLIYPWNLWDETGRSLIEEARPGATYPPTFLVHAHDDKSSSLGSVALYSALKQKDLPAELHIYRNGGHGYGMRPVAGSHVHTWPQRAEEWLAHLSRESAKTSRSFEEFTTPPAEYAGKFGTYRSPLQFADGAPVMARDQWPRRRHEILDAWHKRLGPWPALPEHPNLTVLETTARDGYTEHHWHIEVLPDGTRSDAYLLVPQGKGPFPAVFVPFYEPASSIGREAKARGSFDYGLQLVRRGFITLSIGTPGGVEKPQADTRDLLIRAGVDLRRQPLMLLAYAAAVCHTVLAQRPDVDPARIGVIGFSYGGKWSIFAACLYDKFACAVWSDPGIVFDETNGSVNYWEPWYLGYEPGTQRKAGLPSPNNPRTGLYREMIAAGDDLVELHALMAPRPVLVGGGTADPPRNWQALNHLIAVNRLLGYEGRVAMTRRIPHRPTPEALQQEIDFLEYWLKQSAQ